LYINCRENAGVQQTNNFLSWINLLLSAQPNLTAYYFVFESAAELGSNKACSAAQMDANLSIKQPWHTVYCHLSFSFSDLGANNATHHMLILVKNYAVKTKTAPFVQQRKGTNKLRSNKC
jgi:hypothetical protein